MKLDPRLVSLGLFIVCVTIDQLSKNLAPEHLIYYNTGFIFGSFTELPSSLRIISLSSLGGFLFTLYLFLLRVLSTRFFWLQAALGIFCAGLFGNIIDRAYHAKTIDFIPLHLGELHLVFNVADVFQWIGAVLIAYRVITQEKLLWHPGNQRGKFIVHWRDQLFFSLKMTLTSLCCTLVLGLFCASFLRLSLEFVSSEHQKIAALMQHFFIGYLSLGLIFSLFVFSLSLYLSHRLAGPLYAFEKYVEELLEGSQRRFRLRDGDQAKQLVKIADELHRHLSKKSTPPSE